MSLSLVRSTLTQVQWNKVANSKIIQNVSQVSKRGLAVTAARRADQVMPDPVEHATGEILK